MLMMWARDETKKPPTLLSSSSSSLHPRPAHIASHLIASLDLPRSLPRCAICGGDALLLLLLPAPLATYRVYLLACWLASEHLASTQSELTSERESEHARGTNRARASGTRVVVAQDGHLQDSYLVLGRSGHCHWSDYWHLCHGYLVAHQGRYDDRSSMILDDPR